MCKEGNGRKSLYLRRGKSGVGARWGIMIGSIAWARYECVRVLLLLLLAFICLALGTLGLRCLFFLSDSWDIFFLLRAFLVFLVKSYSVNC
jgi:hypothetical protein